MSKSKKAEQPYDFFNSIIGFFLLLQIFEDTEFHQMEEEARREAEKEELVKEIR